jgi:signal transduction histidine kinase/PAS domain-containing protein
MTKTAKTDLLVIANEEKSELAAELVIVNEEKEKLSAALDVAEKDIAERAAELVIANKEKAKRAAELVIANKEKEKRAAELVVAKSDKAKRAAELVIANAEKAKCAAILVISNLEKEKRSDELIIADKEVTLQNEQKVKLAAELVIADVNKTKREAELVIANIEKAKRAAELVIAGKELSYQAGEKKKRIAELNIAEAEKSKREAELVIANIKKAKRAAELVIANVEKAKRSAELVIANKELVYQKSEKSKRAAELVIANVEKAKRAAELVIANIEKAKRAAEFVFTNKELMLAKEKEKLVLELTIVNKELNTQITERKLAEEELNNSLAFSDILLKTIPFGMDIVDETGTILFQNDNLKRNFRENSIGEKCWDIYRDDKKQCDDCPLIKGITVGETNIYESHGVLGNSIFEISHTGMIYHSKKAMLEIFQDISERKKREAELISSKEKAEESDRLKSAFLTNMSHEIRTPMNGIIGFTELLKEPNLSSEEQNDFLNTIQISGARMLNTINNIVDISKIESGLTIVDINDADINEKIEFTYKFFKPEAEIKGLQFIFRNGLLLKDAIIRTDNEKVYAIISNLVKNAIKFTNDGSIELGYLKKGDYLEFYVKDTGVGIPKNQHEYIFERFRQGSESHNRGYEGSGLGLSISKSFVEMLGGKIWLESEEGRGSTFYFTIPYNLASDENTEIQIPPEEHKETELRKLKILIVEDDEISLSLITRMLKKNRIETYHAITGLEAIEACHNNQDLDLLLMDIRMPRMDGLEATRQIRLFNKNIIIIAQTAFAFPTDKEKAIEAGCNDYITKPVNQALLFELINKYCNI